MTLQEALKSGKRFKRPHATYWISRWSIGADKKELFLLNKSDICASDWEVEDKVITVTESKLYNAFQKLTCGPKEELWDQFASDIGLRRKYEPFKFVKEYD